MQRSSTWILKSLWGACERWSKSDCIDLSAAFAYYTLQSFFPILLISLSIASWFLGKQEGLDQQIISIAAQLLPPSVAVSYTHLRAHETEADLVCRLLL